MTDENPLSNSQKINESSTICVDPVRDLQETILRYFPQYGQVEYHRQTCNPSKGLYSCSLNLFGIPIVYNYVQKPHDVIMQDAKLVSGVPMSEQNHEQTSETWEQAVVKVAQSGLKILNEFLRLFVARKDDQKVGNIISTVLDSLGTYTTAMSSSDRTNIINEAKFAKIGLDRIESIKMTESFHSMKMSPVLHGILSRANGVDVDPAPSTNIDSNNNINGTSSPPDNRVSPITPNNKDILGSNLGEIKPTICNPISLLYSHSHKSQGKLAEPLVSFFTKGCYHGCIVTYNGEEAIVPAAYIRKVDSKHEAFRMLCEKIIGVGMYSFECIKSSIPSKPLSDEDIKKIRESVGKKEFQESHPIITLTSGVKVVKASVETVMSEFPKVPMTGLNLGNSKAVTLLNEFCQQTYRFMPEYTSVPLPSSMVTSNSTAFAMRVKIFDSSTFISYLFSRKIDAKEDCAMRVLNYLVEKGLMSTSFKTINQIKKIETNKQLKRSDHHLPITNERILSKTNKEHFAGEMKDLRRTHHQDDVKRSRESHEKYPISRSGSFHDHQDQRFHDNTVDKSFSSNRDDNRINKSMNHNRHTNTARSNYSWDNRKSGKNHHQDKNDLSSPHDDKRHWEKKNIHPSQVSKSGEHFDFHPEDNKTTFSTSFDSSNRTNHQERKRPFRDSNFENSNVRNLDSLR